MPNEFGKQFLTIQEIMDLYEEAAGKGKSIRDAVREAGIGQPAIPRRESPRPQPAGPSEEAAEQYIIPPDEGTEAPHQTVTPRVRPEEPSVRPTVETVTDTSPAKKTAPAAKAAARAIPGPSAPDFLPGIGSLPPTAQGVVWAEILGQPVSRRRRRGRFGS